MSFCRVHVSVKSKYLRSWCDVLRIWNNPEFFSLFPHKCTKCLLDLFPERAKGFWAKEDVDETFNAIFEYLNHLKRALKKNTATDKGWTWLAGWTVMNKMSLASCWNHNDFLLCVNQNMFRRWCCWTAWTVFLRSLLRSPLWSSAQVNTAFYSEGFLFFYHINHHMFIFCNILERHQVKYQYL